MKAGASYTVVTIKQLHKGGLLWPILSALTSRKRELSGAIAGANGRESLRGPPQSGVALETEMGRPEPRLPDGQSEPTRQGIQPR